MKESTITLTGHEVTFGADEIIVSKTDVKGRIQYVNETFIKISGFTEDELLGQPHSIIRHPEMPRSVFKLLWDTIASGHEIFAYVKNLCKNGDHYWVFAHVTPTFDAQGKIVGYHSNRRSPDRVQVASYSDLYSQLLREEQKNSDWRQGMAAATALLQDIISQQGMSYEELIFSGINGDSRAPQRQAAAPERRPQ